MLTFEELMEEAEDKTTMYRQKMRLRHIKAMREVRNGKQRRIL